jgi:DNA-binding XRE family transcriptional regulator
VQTGRQGLGRRFWRGLGFCGGWHGVAPLNGYNTNSNIALVTKGNKRKMIKGQWQAARALIGWSQSDLAEKVGVVSLTIKRLEGGQAVSDDVRARAQAALEAAGLEFTNGDQPGVRLRKGKS